MYKLYTDRQPIDPLTVLDALRKAGRPVEDKAILDIISITPTAANAEIYAKGLLNAHKIRLIRDVLQTAAYDDAADAEELAESVMTGLYEATRGERRQRAKHISALAGDYWLSLSQTDDRQLDIGLPSADAILGGVRPSNLIIIAARPGVGKSALAGHMAYRAASKGIKTLIFSLEMTGREIIERYVAAQTKITLDGVRSKHFVGTDEAKEVTSALGAMSELPLYICPDSGVTTVDIRRELQIASDAGLVVVDYLQLMRSPKKLENRNLEIAEISGELKRIAKEFNIPVVALSQFNRTQNEYDEPGLSGFRDSGAIEQDADIAMLLWRLEASQSGALDKVGVKVAKNRMGKTGVVVMYFDGEHMSFKETAEKYRPVKRGRRREFVPVDCDLPAGW